jgi:tRNA threonylcarbamoyladenosine biosynthesis protein TsaB
LKILGIETSSHLFSLCISEDDTVLYEIIRNRLADDSRDAHFFVEAEKLLEYWKTEPIGVIAIDSGPGMFTSLRVGLTFAKGLAISQNIPVVTVKSLDVIGNSFTFSQYPVLAVINAYHGELYAALYSQGKRLTDYLLTKPEEIKKLIREKTVVIGSGVDLVQETYGQETHFIYSRDVSLLPTASKVIAEALPRIKKKQFEDIEMLEPYYIKKTDAERNYNKTDASR